MFSNLVAISKNIKNFCETKFMISCAEEFCNTATSLKIQTLGRVLRVQAAIIRPRVLFRPRIEPVSPM